MKQILLTLFSCFSIGICIAQPKSPVELKTDSIAWKIIGMLKRGQPDSLYELTGTAFRDQISADDFRSVVIDRLLPINKFETVSYVTSMEGINKYRVEGTPVLQLLVGLDADNKISTLLVQQYSE
ncbi:MAG: class beta-lactamase-related serine hydrolase [Ferruginibacter sp.]|nr:class beta-lactamase-related serine hydrolase [Ferruginibacter sp.]